MIIIMNATRDDKDAARKTLKERKMVKVMGLVLGVYITSYIPTAIFHPFVAGRPQTRAIVIGSR